MGCAFGEARDRRTRVAKQHASGAMVVEQRVDQFQDGGAALRQPRVDARLGVADDARKG